MFPWQIMYSSKFFNGYRLSAILSLLMRFRSFNMDIDPVVDFSANDHMDNPFALGIDQSVEPHKALDTPESLKGRKRVCLVYLNVLLVF